MHLISYPHYQITKEVMFYQCFILALILQFSHAGFRCNWFFVSTTGNSMRTVSCVVLGQTSGICTSAGECM